MNSCIKSNNNYPVLESTPTPSLTQIPYQNKIILNKLDQLIATNQQQTKEFLLFGAIHQIKNQAQRNSFKEHKTTNGVGKMLIDFKQNICIGMCSEQESQQYYNQNQRQLLGIWVKTNGKDIFF